ncbi:MAG: dihydrodipicolinate synthase family protein [Methanosarcinales archaeon]|nr:dihydrodipicolinate synthase family protein [Methanosarcinales archaeon]
MVKCKTTQKDIPILLYNIPVLTAVTFPRTVVEDLTYEDSNVVAIKDI